MSDPHDLNRFVDAQERDYERAVAEVTAGEKLTHWMWYVFPQLAELGRSAMAKRYGIRDIEEARAFMAHPVLGPRLERIAEAVVAVEGRSAHEIFGSPDDMKLRSCATLFAAVCPAGSVFERILAKYYDGVGDAATLQLIDSTRA